MREKIEKTLREFGITNVRDYEEDSIPSVTFKVGGTKIDLMCCGPHVVGATKYCMESKLAMNDLVDEILNQLEVDDELRQWVDSL